MPRAAFIAPGKRGSHCTKYLPYRLPHVTRKKRTSKFRIFNSLTKECAKHRKQSFSSPCVLRYMRTLSLQVLYLPLLRKTDPCVRAPRANCCPQVPLELSPPVPGNPTQSIAYRAECLTVRFPPITQLRRCRNRNYRDKIKTAFAAPEPLGYGSGFAETVGIALFIRPQRPQTL